MSWSDQNLVSAITAAWYPRNASVTYAAGRATLADDAGAIGCLEFLAGCRR
jgi:hypothetical protein